MKSFGIFNLLLIIALFTLPACESSKNQLAGNGEGTMGVLAICKQVSDGLVKCNTSAPGNWAPTAKVTYAPTASTGTQTAVATLASVNENFEAIYSVTTQNLVLPANDTLRGEFSTSVTLDGSEDVPQTVVTPYLWGDFNLDGCVNSADFQLFTARFNTAVVPGVLQDPFDCNGDRVIDISDFNCLRLAFGQGLNCH